MNKEQLLVYDCLVFDGDGTLFDSNSLKFHNIQEALKDITGDEVQAKNFADWFIRESGIPREEKIYGRFDKQTGARILEKYNQLNSETIEDVPLVPGTLELLEVLFQAGKKVILFSAGDATEIQRILYRNRMDKFFAVKLTGSQKTKEFLVQAIGGQSAVYFGDALKDFLVARELEIPFVYVNGYTLKVMDFSEQLESPLLSVKNYFEILGD